MLLSLLAPAPVVAEPLVLAELLMLDPLVPVVLLPVVPVSERVEVLPVVGVPAFGPDVAALLLGEPEAPPWLPALVPELEPDPV